MWEDLDLSWKESSWWGGDIQMVMMNKKSATRGFDLFQKGFLSRSTLWYTGDAWKAMHGNYFWGRIKNSNAHFQWILFLKRIGASIVGRMPNFQGEWVPSSLHGLGLVWLIDPFWINCDHNWLEKSSKIHNYNYNQSMITITNRPVLNEQKVKHPLLLLCF